MKTPGFFLRHEKRIAIILLLALYLGLIRTCTEFFRLEYVNGSVPVEHVRGLFAGACAAAVGCLAMTIAFFYSRYRLMMVLFVLAIAGMLVIKSAYHIG